MKKALIIALVLLTSLAANAQKESKVRLSSQKTLNAKSHHVNLCQLKAYSTNDGKIKVLVDFGDTKVMDQNQVKEIKTEGYAQSFTNTVDALRYMKKYKWRIVETYSLIQQKSEVVYFIMSR